MPWSTSTRRRGLPRDWPRRRALVLVRDRHRCQWPVDGESCGVEARDVDHKDRHGGHALDNLWSLCGPHHDAKTGEESTRVRWRYRDGREPEQHPGTGWETPPPGAS